jgi:hypothetical protein
MGTSPIETSSKKKYATALAKRQAKSKYKTRDFNMNIKFYK